MNSDGKNGAGDSIIDKARESIEKFPLKKLKSNTSSVTTTASTDAASAVASGW
jgi:hypothetical protein